MKRVFPMTFLTGHDFAGKVVKVGGDSDPFRIGECLDSVSALMPRSPP
jgi:NADPH:quinone reductase-like Zn-dependent oxidoreductase